MKSNSICSMRNWTNIYIDCILDTCICVAIYYNDIISFLLYEFIRYLMIQKNDVTLITGIHNLSLYLMSIIIAICIIWSFNFNSIPIQTLLTTSFCVYFILMKNIINLLVIISNPNNFYSNFNSNSNADQDNSKVYKSIIILTCYWLFSSIYFLYWKQPYQIFPIPHVFGCVIGHFVANFVDILVYFARTVYYTVEE